ncbi:hypothetical protein CWI84_03825 [Idiomarina tyrosinivorans]|uniref:EAL domain-containing protein n=1 Tax=Idiomarina tyrosinivorans TaxID=1445662 RepID=A0A432ZS75_9GAMM|nr:hypothetical protein [Idiomarina tyrosinivorans]RUO80723.1 hypothetical protein CWI84_03825 [Idiomarina tyrosinivorans]
MKFNDFLNQLLRCPIFDARDNVVGYQLEFCHGLRTTFPSLDTEARERLCSELAEQLPRLTLGKDAIIQFNSDGVCNGVPNLLPKEQVWVSVVDNGAPDRKLLDACKELVERGYRIALTDHDPYSHWEPFYQIAGVIELSVSANQSLTELTKNIAAVKRHGCEVLVYGTLDRLQREHCQDLGVNYFVDPEYRSVAHEPHRAS